MPNGKVEESPEADDDVIAANRAKLAQKLASKTKKDTKWVQINYFPWTPIEKCRGQIKQATSTLNIVFWYAFKNINQTLQANLDKPTSPDVAPMSAWNLCK